jgi:polysaccharide pyruvyl transferase WcaK-like protein
MVRLAHRWGIPTMWWGVGVEPLVTGLGRALARRMVAWSAPGAVSVRDEGSHKLLVQAGVPPAAVRVTADPALALPSAPAADLARLLAREELTLGGGAHVAVCLRNLPRDPLGWGPGYLLPVSLRERLTRRLPNRAARAHAQRSAYFFALLAQAADHLITQHDVRVLFVPFWPGRDEAQAAQVVAQMRHPERTHILRGEVSAPVLRALLGEMDAVLALRLHALIFAAAGGVPALGFSYARKVPAFLAAAGLPDHALDPAAFDWVRLLRAVNHLWATRAAARRTLLAHVAPLQAAAAQDLATAARLLGLPLPVPPLEPPG